MAGQLRKLTNERTERENGQPGGKIFIFVYMVAVAAAAAAGGGGVAEVDGVW